ncbi:XrtY-associated glycosyltransferase XYAG1 [Pedobacter nototheniae]|uniref:XrtY-associated glycosyltransferase XYAG1 n=1 Tax=Pedobacter nototheniae TaxID=2488994 RepID=UPI0029317695|nr:glycosyltransferase [Pedobacter nototheniae]
MKIIHITASYKPAYIYGGPIQSVGILCEQLRVYGKKLNCEIELLTTTANGKTELDVIPGKTYQVNGVSVRYFNRLTKDHTHFSPSLLHALAKEIKKNKEQKLVIHIHAWWNLVSILSCLVAKWYKIPVVLSPRGMLTSYTLSNRNGFTKDKIHRFLGEKLLEYSRIHATSEKEKADILSLIHPKSIIVIPNMVNFPTAQINRGISKPNDPFKLIFLSRIEEKKGLELLFDALSTIKMEWSLTLAGSGEAIYLNKLKTQIKTLGIQDHISWIGQVSNEHKFNLMAKHDLLVLTSFNENFANVVIESLSVGTPALISKQVGLADYVDSKGLGWITNLDVESIRKNILSAYADRQKRQFINETAHHIINTDFNPEKITGQYMDLYQSIENFE